MKFKLRERFDGWVQGLVDAAVKRHIPTQQSMINAVSTQLNYDGLAQRLKDDATFVRGVSEWVSEGVDIDTDDLAGDIAANFTAEDIAYHIDGEEVARHIEVDEDSIAEKVCEEIDVASIASELDYDKLAEALVEKLKEAWA